MEVATKQKPTDDNSKTAKPVRKKSVQKGQFHASRLTQEQKEWILVRLSLRWPGTIINEAFQVEFETDRKISPQLLDVYKKTHADRIAEIKDAQNKDLVNSGIPFVQQRERLAEYARIAQLERKRKRHDDECARLKNIAEEMGDLRTNASIAITQVDPAGAVEGHLAEVAGILKAAGITPGQAESPSATGD